MKISKQARRDAKALLTSCRVNGVLDDARVLQTVQSVIEQKPRGYLAVLGHFHRLVKLDLERRAARVESAIPLSPALQSDLSSSLTRRYGPGLDFSFTQNSDLIGGMKIRVGSDVFDGSVRARLDSLADAFVTGLNR